MILVPENRPPTTPGELLREDFLRPLGITQEELAELIGVSFQTVNRLVNGKQSLTPNLAMRLARLFGTSPDFWLNFQLRCDLYREMQEARSDIQRIKPLGRSRARDPSVEETHQADGDTPAARSRGNGRGRRTPKSMKSTSTRVAGRGK